MSRNIEQEHATELGDHAYNAEQVRLKADLDRARAGAVPERHPDFDGTHCVACGEPIASARLVLEKIRCIECQEEVERIARGFGRGY